MSQETYGELQSVTLVISAGSLPNLECSTLNEAEQILGGIQLNVELGSEIFSDCPEGSVVRIDPALDGDGNPRAIREGDTVTLIISRGPDLVQVPDVIGDRISAAIAELEALDFIVNVQTDLPQGLWGSFAAEVLEQDPEPGEMLKCGSEVTIYGLQS